jgi:hypothetical protein
MSNPCGYIDGVFTTRRHLLYTADGLPCRYCGRAMRRRRDQRALDEPTLDHIVPIARGTKRDAIGACAIVCRQCNADKDKLTLNEWRAALAVRYCTIPVFWFEREAIRAAIRLAVLRLSGVALYL